MLARRAAAARSVKDWAKRSGGQALVVACTPVRVKVERAAAPRLPPLGTPRLARTTAAPADRHAPPSSAHRMQTRLSTRRAEFETCLGGHADPGELLTPGLD